MNVEGSKSDAPAVIREALLPKLVAPSVVSQFQSVPTAAINLIIECNADYPGGIAGARQRVRILVQEIAGSSSLARDITSTVTDYVHVLMDANQLSRIVIADGTEAMTIAVNEGVPDAKLPPAAPRRANRAIRHVWASSKLHRLATQSIRTVKADAAHASFMAMGDGITWAVLDSGVDGTHPHFKLHGNVKVAAPLAHKNFSPTGAVDPLVDAAGHGTHVAGIIAGQCDQGSSTLAAIQSIAEDGTPSEYHLDDVATICGMAPKCKILSLRIFDDAGDGDDTAAIQALEHILEMNAYGTHIRVHGINLSAGYLPDPQTYGIGQSPLCKTVDRVVSSGVVVVCAAGNFGWTPGSDAQLGQSGALASIADPGNANLAITVGSTHRQQPHTFGISFFSSKGPTVDGRMKPDVVAPGERIISCATGALKTKSRGYLPAPADGLIRDFAYAEDSGTSMSAPHVSGILAAFLSVRSEFIGEPIRVAELVRLSAMDLRRDERMQGAGLVDLFKMLQSV